MGPGTSFHRVLHDDVALSNDRDVKRVVLCSGKVYYDLFEERAKRAIKDICFLRLEQLRRTERAAASRSRLVPGGAAEHGRMDVRASRDRIHSRRYQA
jgi:hypothetical protein